jgi:hypothetical protein
MADWLGTGAVEQIWRPTWARGGYDLRQVVSRWLRSASSCGGGSGLRSGASSAYTPICWWLWICWCGGSRWVGVDGYGFVGAVTLSGLDCCGFAGAVGHWFFGWWVAGCDLCVVCEFSGGYGRL